MEEKEILNQEWFRGVVEFIAKKAKTGVIKAEDGTLVEFDDKTQAVFERLNEADEVLFTLSDDEPDLTGVNKASRILPDRQDE